LDSKSGGQNKKKGAIMKPSTFQDIKDRAIKQGLSEARASNVAGAAYWNAAEKKYPKHGKEKK
jgi:hypothetical protein